MTTKCKLSDATYADLNELKDVIIAAEEFQLPLNYLSESKDVREMLQTSVNKVSFTLQLNHKSNSILNFNKNLTSDKTLSCLNEAIIYLSSTCNDIYKSKTNEVIVRGAV